VRHAGNGNGKVVGVDVRSLRTGLDQIGGVGIYTREVVGRILEETRAAGPAIRVVPFGGFRLGSRAAETLGGFGPGRPTVATSSLPGHVLVTLWEKLGWPPLESVIGPCDLLHGTDHFLPPHRCPKRIYTSHDLIAISRPDLTSDFHRRFVEAQLPAWQRPGSFFISVSEFTRREMTRLVGLPSERIRVIPNAVSAEFRPVQGSGDRTRLEAFRATHGLSRRFLLAVANTNRNKNLVNLLRAVRIVLERTSAVDQLVLCGNQGWRDGPLRREADSLGDRLRLVSLPRGEMPLLYAAATALVFASLYEGFGLPVLEAMACGTPVVSSRAAALPETGGDAAVYFDPEDPEAIASATVAVVEDDGARASLAERGLAHAATFSWARSARETLEAYREALAA
jgi:glycosyltransferase involved in cell wall biosynthesis